MSTIRLICLPLATISWELNPAYVNAIALKYEVSSTSFWPFLFLPPLIAMSSFPLQPYEVKGRNHAIASTVGFLILLPIGVLVPRYCRTFTKRCVSLCSMTLCNIFSWHSNHYKVVARSLDYPVPHFRACNNCRMGFGIADPEYAAHRPQFFWYPWSKHLACQHLCWTNKLTAAENWTCVIHLVLCPTVFRDLHPLRQDAFFLPRTPSSAELFPRRVGISHHRPRCIRSKFCFYFNPVFSTSDRVGALWS